MTSNPLGLTPEQLKTHRRLMADFPFYAEHVLKVAAAGGGPPIPFHFNPAQRYMHARLEEQRKTQGWVRAINLKARRLGFSTYVAGRFYHRASTTPGVKAFILSHHSKTTQVLFNITRMFHKEAPVVIQPELATSNVYQIIFDKFDSEYAVGTAGSAEIGRGFTVQLFHGSEVAFWENTNKITAGVLQAIELLPNTEIILESTANGKGNMFHTMCMDALQGDGDFQLIFAPWYWHPAYSRPAPPDFVLDAEEMELKQTPIKMPSATGLPLIDTFLHNDQLYWRRQKKVEFRREADPDGKFKQEYPATVAEAFQKSGKRLILASKIAAARKATVTDPGAPIVMGCDLARTRNKIVFAYRQGRQLLDYEVIPNVEVSDNPTNVLTGLVAQRLIRRRVDRCFIDYGHGHGVFDNLQQLGYTKLVQLVHFNEASLEPGKYANKRTEIIIALRDWLHEGGVSIPDLEELDLQLSCLPDAGTNARGVQAMALKAKIEQESGLDLGILDAAALTFSSPVARRTDDIAHVRKATTMRNQISSKLKTRQRVQGVASRRQDAVLDWGGR